MKHAKPTLILLFLLGSICAWAETRETRFHRGVEAYESGDYATAAAFFTENLYDPTSADFYNLGNAYFRMGELGQAILCYESAHRISPRDRDIKENLELCYSKTEDQIEPLPQMFLARWWRGANAYFTSREWAWLFLGALALAGAALCVFFLSHNYLWRKRSFIAACVVGVLLLLTGAQTWTALHRPQEAIVMAPMTVVKSAPTEESTDLFILHEGTKVTCDDENAPWVKIHIADGQKGWILHEAMKTF